MQFKTGCRRSLVETLMSCSSIRLGPMLLFAALWLTMLSSMLVESYAYRYAGAMLVLLAVIEYVRCENRPRVMPVAWLCTAWGVYVLTRFSFCYLFLRDHPLGERELLFAMPLTFPAVAFVLSRTWWMMEAVIAIFFGAALAVLVFTARFQSVFAGETVSPLIHHNQIHCAVCCGLLLIASIMWLLHYHSEPGSRQGLKLYVAIVSLGIIFLCNVAIYGAKSKGVWLALGLISPAIVFVITRYLTSRVSIVAITCLGCIVALSVYAVRHSIYQTAGPTALVTTSMLRELGATNQIGSAVTSAIGNNSTPVSMDERLQLWSNAWNLFTTAPLFGWANEWSEQWPLARYHVNYTIMHNGYLEILVRHGLFGAVILAIMFFCFCRATYRAARLCLIPRAAMHAYFLTLLFFSFTLLSNSNNRLAMGESFILLSSAFALICEFKYRELTRIG